MAFGDAWPPDLYQLPPANATTSTRLSPCFSLWRRFPLLSAHASLTCSEQWSRHGGRQASSSENKRLNVIRNSRWRSDCVRRRRCIVMCWKIRLLSLNVLLQPLFTRGAALIWQELKAWEGALAHGKVIIESLACIVNLLNLIQIYYHSVLHGCTNGTPWWAFPFSTLLCPCPSVTLVISEMWNKRACLSGCAWLLMGDWMPDESVIRTADLITHRYITICSWMRPWVLLYGGSYMLTWAYLKSKGVSFPSLSVIVVHSHEYASVWQSVSVCEDERPGQIK